MTQCTEPQHADCCVSLPLSGCPKADVVKYLHSSCVGKQSPQRLLSNPGNRHFMCTSVLLLKMLLCLGCVNGILRKKWRVFWTNIFEIHSPPLLASNHVLYEVAQLLSVSVNFFLSQLKFASNLYYFDNK